MKIHIVGDGSFGTFMKKILPEVGFTLDEKAETVMLAVPFSALAEVTRQFSRRRHLINVCSVQAPSQKIIREVGAGNKGWDSTCIHPLFGARTPREHYHSIVTYEWGFGESLEFLEGFAKISKLHREWNGVKITPQIHDQLMKRTHKAAVQAANQLRPFAEGASDIPDHLIPNSFRLLRKFVSTLDDMPAGTLESIMANEQ